VRRISLLLGASLGSLILLAGSASGANYNVNICSTWSPNQGPLVPSASPGMNAGASSCGYSNGLLHVEVNSSRALPSGSTASWTTTAPAGLTITHIYTVNDFSIGVGDNHGWWGEFFWNGGPGPAGRSDQIRDNFQTYGCCQASFNDKTIGWFITCVASSCSDYAALDVGGIDLSVDESQGPWLNAPAGLWQTSGWIRNQWPLVFSGDSPSGVCSLSAAINGQSVTLGPGATVGRNTGTWHQCAGASASATIQTAGYGQGPMPLTISGCDAAGVCTGGAYTKTIYVDNSQPWVSLASPGEVADTGQTQYVTATAGAARPESPRSTAGSMVALGCAFQRVVLRSRINRCR
jgi:hypothetical protein